MNNENKDNYDRILEQLEILIENKIYELLDRNGIEVADFASVTSVSDTVSDSSGNITSVGSATVSLSNGQSIYNLKNKTGEILSVGDKVKIYGSRTNLANRYIGLKI